MSQAGADTPELLGLERPEPSTLTAYRSASGDLGTVAIELPVSAGRPVKRSFSIRGHRTSISLEAPFWDALVALAAERRMPVAGLVAAVDAARGKSGLSSAIRVVVLEHYRSGKADRDRV